MDQYSRGLPSIGAALSLEASLDEENREVLAILDKQRSGDPRSRTTRGTTPPPPVRSMLDIDTPPRSRHGSSAGLNLAPTASREQRRPSKTLDPSDPSTWTRPHAPVANRPSIDLQQGLPKINLEEKKGFEEQYNFDMASMPSSAGGAIRSPQEKRKNSGHMATTLGSDISSMNTTGNSPPGRLISSATTTGNTSTKVLPLTSEAMRPHIPTLNVTSADANRRLSNKSSSFSDVSEGPVGRVEKDEDGDEDALAYTSDEDVKSSSSDGDSPDAQRGRTRAKSPPPPPKDEVERKAEDNQEEGLSPPQSRGVRSLLDPITSPSRPSDRKPEVHPPSSFGRSGPTAADFEDEDDMDADIKKAKTLGLNISDVDASIPDRHVRMIIRGDWAKLQEEAENANRSSKVYLTCTDLSIEATYALEWTVGTMLRDGDTLLAMYAIEDESAPKEPEGNAVVIAESQKAAHEASDTMVKLTRRTTGLEGTTTIPPAAKPTSKFLPVTEALTSTSSADGRKVSKKEMERLRAMDDIMNNFLKLVRKTPLQIRCMIEVIHCKSPKHLLLNAIDELDPTLCVVGTRGRSSLKGVLLGSFSNYLVTKSSVPVMVARKRLKKPRHAKVNSSSIRLANNLRTSALTRPKRGLENARID